MAKLVKRPIRDISTPELFYTVDKCC